MVPIQKGILSFIIAKKNGCNNKTCGTSILGSSIISLVSPSGSNGGSSSKSSSSDITSLLIVGNAHCTPVYVNDKFNNKKYKRRAEKTLVVIKIQLSLMI